MKGVFFLYKLTKMHPGFEATLERQDQGGDFRYKIFSGNREVLDPDRKISKHFSPETNELKAVFTGSGFTSFDVVAYGSKTIIGTGNGYIEINNLNQRQIGEVRRNLPVTEITGVK